MKTALIVSTYNWPEALSLVIKSVYKQSVFPHEIIIADDGSTQQTKQLIAEFCTKGELNIKHIWHEDKGFRKAAILNKAIASSHSDYIIQVDGDCILHPSFIEDHLRNASPGQFLFGTRVHVKQKYVQAAIAEGKQFFSFFSQGIKKRPRAIRLPLINSFAKAEHILSPKFRGCNCSFWRSDLIAVNGYNEDFVGWGREDTEIVVRILRNGIKGKRIKFQGIVFHLDHDNNSRSNLTKNDEILTRIEESNLILCKNGIDKYI